MAGSTAQLHSGWRIEHRPSGHKVKGELGGARKGNEKGEEGGGGGGGGGGTFKKRPIA